MAQLRKLRLSAMESSSTYYKKDAGVGILGNQGVAWFVHSFSGLTLFLQLTQWSGEKMTTFEAYEALGLLPDFRDYGVIKDILVIFGIFKTHSFALMSNNPTKINGLRDLGIKIAQVKRLEFPSNPFNQAYLYSKQQTGHALTSVVKKQKVQKFDLPKAKRVKPFDPYLLPQHDRFIHCASYYIPVRPYKNWILLPKDRQKEFSDLDKRRHLENSSLFRFTAEEIEAHSLFFPYWFRIFMYYDVIRSVDYVILRYDDRESKDDNVIPCVRIHSESIFDRFPLRNARYRKKMSASIFEIVKRGYGFIGLFQHDGKGTGLGYYILNYEHMVSSRQKDPQSPKPGEIDQDERRNIRKGSPGKRKATQNGEFDDFRDFEAMVTLLVHHFDQDAVDKIDVLFHKPQGSVSGVFGNRVRYWINQDTISLRKRYLEIPVVLKWIENADFPPLKLPENCSDCVVTG